MSGMPVFEVGHKVRLACVNFGSTFHCNAHFRFYYACLGNGKQ